MKLSKRTKLLTESALIAALYAVLTMISFAFGLDKGVVQLRLSECLAVLPVFTPAAVPGLAVGCALASFLGGAHLLDVLFGSLITLVAAEITYLLRGMMRRRFGALLAPLPNILLNTLLIPIVLIWVYRVPDAYGFLVLTVGMGELLACGVLGAFLHTVLKRSATALWHP